MFSLVNLRYGNNNLLHGLYFEETGVISSSNLYINTQFYNSNISHPFASCKAQNIMVEYRNNSEKRYWHCHPWTVNSSKYLYHTCISISLWPWDFISVSLIRKTFTAWVNQLQPKGRDRNKSVKIMTVSSLLSARRFSLVIENYSL